MEKIKEMFSNLQLVIAAAIITVLAAGHASRWFGGVVTALTEGTNYIADHFAISAIGFIVVLLILRAVPVSIKKPETKSPAKVEE